MDYLYISRTHALKIALTIAERRFQNLDKVKLKSIFESNCSIGVQVEKPYVVVIIVAGDNSFVGIAKYNPNDKKLGKPYNPHIGARLALHRAINKLLRHIQE